jgi:hypothetical protein
MLKWKSQLTCTYCSKIYKDPVDLPCDDSICRAHLSERKVVKGNRIKCKECKQAFQVEDSQFKLNKTLKKLLESQCYMSEEEICLKLELEALVRKFVKCYDAFIQNKTQLKWDIFEHFQEMRSQIDHHRDDLKKRIDDIALEMINQTEKYEEIYLNVVNENFSAFEKKSLVNELNKIEDTFRDPNLLIQTIREMHLKHEESLKDIQLKLNEINQVKDDLKAANYFKPNLSIFNQKEASLFGSIKLTQNSSKKSFKSQILKGEQQMSELMKLCEFSPYDKWSLLYRATRDGFGSNDFHTKCDGHSSTLTILKAKRTSYIFGGFTAVSWASSGRWKSDPNAFIFSFVNKENKPIKMKIDPNHLQYAIYCHSGNGPTFGGGCDIHVGDNAHTKMNNYTDFYNTYKHPQCLTDGAKKVFFELDEIEVYQKE